MKDRKKKKKNNIYSWLFPAGMLILFGIMFFINKEAFFKSIDLLKEILIRILPVFIIIFILMMLVNRFITAKFLIRHLSSKGIKKWVYTIIGGTLSSGPIYMWYPLLSELKDKGLSYGLIACFLYNRAIKIPLLPLAIVYFGTKYVIVLTGTMILASILQGIIINWLMRSQAKETRSDQ